MKKVITSVFVVALLIAILAACGGNPAPSTQNPPSNNEPAPNAAQNNETSAQQNPAPQNSSGEKLKVGIIQLVEHPALDAACQGFTESLAAHGYTDGDNITIDFQNGQNDQSNLKAISQKFVNDKCDLILAIATPAAQSIAAETKDIPIVITAVTDPADAKLVVSNDNPQTNVTGTSDMAPYKEQLDLLVKLLPDMKNLAVIYNSSEQNSILQAELVEEYAVGTLGLSVEHKTLSSSNDIDQVAQSLVGKFDAIYTPTDNTVASAMPTLANVAITNKIPIMTAEEGMVEGGGMASVSISYYELGYKSGEMAAKILNGESNPQDMPIEYAPKPTLIFNAAAFKAMDMEIPPELMEGATIINE